MIYHVTTTARDRTHAQRMVSALSARGMDRDRLTIGNALRVKAQMNSGTFVPLTIITSDHDEVPALKDLLTHAGGSHTRCMEETGLCEIL